MLVLHIGYAKSATTFLQKNIFPNIRGINYIGRYYGEEHSNNMKADWVYDFVFKDNISIKNFAKNILNDMTSEDKPNLISHEVLLRPYMKYRLLHRIKKLENYVGKIRLVISIRNQMDIILSRCVHDRGIASYSIIDALDFEGITHCQWPFCSMNNKTEKCICKQAGIKFINIPFYNYLDLMCLSTPLFGDKNIHFIVNENLRHNPIHEINRLTNFFGVTQMDKQFLRNLENKSENVQQNKLLYNEVRDDYTSSGKKEEVFEYFKISNKLLSEAYQLDLDKYGYY